MTDHESPASGAPRYGISEQAEDIAQLAKAKAEAYAVRHRIQAAERERGLTRLSERKFFLTDGATTGWMEVAALASLSGAKATRSLWLDIAAGYKAYTCVRASVQQSLAERSWFLPDVLDPGDVLALKQLVDQGQSERLDAAMVQVARRAEPFARNRIQALFPDRWLILQESFKAHRDEMYAVSVPTMLAQAEGIGRDIWDGLNVMSSKKSGSVRQELTADLARVGLVDETVDAFVGQVFGTNRIRSSSSELSDDDWSEGRVAFLNRHAVFHGHDLTYATESNGLRCVLLLDLLADIHLLVPPRDNG